MSNSSIREKIAEIVKENADRILALFPQELKSIGAEDRPYNPKVLEDTYDDKPKEWPKKEKCETIDNCNFGTVGEECHACVRNQALDDCLKAHQSIVAENTKLIDEQGEEILRLGKELSEKDREIAELRSKLNEKG